MNKAKKPEKKRIVRSPYLKERKCEIEPPPAEIAFKRVLCQRRIKLQTEDIISLDSIFSHILDQIEPEEEQFKALKWDVTAKEEHSEKQCVIFKEQLYVSKVQNACLLKDNLGLFRESELQEIGTWSLNVEESYDGYVVFSHSKLIKIDEIGDCRCPREVGHCLRGKYTNDFRLVAERRKEIDYIGNMKVEKSLDARIIERDDIILAKRETIINEDATLFVAKINIKDRNEKVLLDGGAMLALRYLIVNCFRGEHEYYTMTVSGKMFRCSLKVHKERKTIRIFDEVYKNCIHATTTVWNSNKQPEDVMETYYTCRGRIVLHYWQDHPYLIHLPQRPIRIKSVTFPKLQLMWKSCEPLYTMYKTQIRLNYKNARTVLRLKPQYLDFITDFLNDIVRSKPEHILEYAIRYFLNLKDEH